MAGDRQCWYMLLPGELVIALQMVMHGLGSVELLRRRDESGETVPGKQCLFAFTGETDGEVVTSAANVGRLVVAFSSENLRASWSASKRSCS